MDTKIEMLPNERVIMSAGKDELTLTSKRVRYHYSEIGRSNFMSITLDSVASCGLIVRTHPVLILLAIIAFIFGVNQDNEPRLILIGLSLFLVVLYFTSRKTLIAIGSNGGSSIEVPIKGVSKANVIVFLEAVERSKLRITQPES